MFKVNKETKTTLWLHQSNFIRKLLTTESLYSFYISVNGIDGTLYENC